MTGLDVQQWLICTAVALSIIVASEIRKAVKRRSHPPKGEDIPGRPEQDLGEASPRKRGQTTAHGPVSARRG